MPIVFKQDVEVAEGELKKLQRKVVKEYTMEQKQSFLAQLNTYAEAHSMKQGKGGCYGWSIHKYAEKFGVAPSGKINWGAREKVGDEVSRYITYCNIKYAKSIWKKISDDPRTDAPSAAQFQFL
jgi:hypothetical protein